MMNDPLKRKMFRQVGMSKQPMGILASSPELMNTVKGYNVGGINLLNQDPPPPMVRDIKTASLQIPAYGTERYSLTGAIKPTTRPGSSVLEDPDLTNETPLALLKKKQEEEAKKIDTSLETKPNIINATNKKIIDEKTETKKEETTKNNNIKPKPDFTNKVTPSADNLYGGVSEKITEEATKISDAYDKLTTNTADLKDMEFLGTTFNKEAAKQMELLKSKDKEFTIAEAQEVYKKMGGKTDEELDEQYGEDREASFWLNMMKAGAAMAAGGSSNTLTNFAKGFTVGLEGYGKDIGQLRKELREDKKESSKTIYKLLQDGKSERLAKKALDIQKSAAITNLLKTEVGDEQARLIREVENEVANRKLTISVYKSFADMNFETKKFNVGRDDFNKSITMAYAKMMPEDLKILQAAGQIKIIDPTKPLTPDNITATPEGVKNIENLLTKNLSGKITDTQVAISTAGGLGKTDSGIVFDKEQEGYNKKEIGTAIKEYNKRRTETIKSLGQETNIVANQDIQFAKVYGGKIDLSKQTERMKQIFTAPGKDGTRSLLEKNIELFTNIN
jgi:hypothetical protein